MGVKDRLVRQRGTPLCWSLQPDEGGRVGGGNMVSRGSLRWNSRGLLALKNRVRVSALMFSINHFASLGFSSFCVK